MNFKLLFLLLGLVALQSCSKSEIITNNEIDAKTRKIIKIKNDSLFTAFKEQDYRIYTALCSEELKQNLRDTLKNVTTIFSAWNLREANYSLLDEYYVKNSKISKNELASEKHNYEYTYVNTDNESYISLLTIPLCKKDDVLVIVHYGLKNKEWKINSLTPLLQGFYGHSAFDIYEMAKKEEEKGYLIDSYLYAALANSIVTDGGDEFKYTYTLEIENYWKNINNQFKARYSFPLTLYDIETQPVINGFSTGYLENNFYPALKYTSRLSVTDEDDLTKEYLAIKAKMKILFPDLNLNQKYILYRAFNEIPDNRGNSRFELHEFADKRTK